MAEKPRTGRIVEIAVDQMTAAQRAAYDRLVSGPRGRLPTPYKVWLQSPKLAEGMEGLGTYLVQGSSLTKREIEIAILLIAGHFEAEYVFRAHWREAEEAGVAREVVTAIRAKAAPPIADPRELAVYRASVALPGRRHRSTDLRRRRRAIRPTRRGRSAGSARLLHVGGFRDQVLRGAAAAFARRVTRLPNIAARQES
jgi:alkylhydroperoxidase family enzyme